MRDLLPKENGRAAPASAATDLGAEQRAAPRVGVMIRSAKLITPQGEYLCVVRDVSETGVSARIFHDLPECEEMLLEVQNGDQYEMSIVWQDGERAGFRFRQPTDIGRLVHNPSRYAKRPVRLHIEATARMHVVGKELDVTLQDISQQGAKVLCDTHLPLEARATLQAAGLAETRAQVRWRRKGAYGLVFEDTMQFAELALTALNMQRALR